MHFTCSKRNTISLTDETHIVEGRKGGAELSKIGRETLPKRRTWKHKELTGIQKYAPPQSN